MNRRECEIFVETMRNIMDFEANWLREHFGEESINGKLYSTPHAKRSNDFISCDKEM